MSFQPSKPSHRVSQHEKAVIGHVKELRIDEDFSEVATERIGREIVQLHSRAPQRVDPIASNEFIHHVLKYSLNKYTIITLDLPSISRLLARRWPEYGESSPSTDVLNSCKGRSAYLRPSSTACRKSHYIPGVKRPLWLFAATNVSRVAFMQKYGLESFGLSQSYLFFWDKFEMTNRFVEQIIAASQEATGSRLVQQRLTDLIGDGGQMSMVQGLVAIYGQVLKAIYPDDWLLREELSADPSQAVVEVIRWNYLEKSGKSHTLSISPEDFARDTYGSDLRVSLETLDGMIPPVHDPRHKAMSFLTVDRLGNIVGGRKVEYVNVEIAILKTSCVRMIKAVCQPSLAATSASLATRTWASWMQSFSTTRSAFVTTCWAWMDKAGRLMTGESKMTHTMVLTAVHIDEATGRPLRWRVQNSWGPSAGDKGWFVMTDAWMNEFIYQAVIDPRLGLRAARDVLKQDPVTFATVGSCGLSGNGSIMV
ncbi:hypothetical protein LLEC1_00200 [Akanthomyces lecanii]|uniref:Bleomycin hydrolase n=1 Tax=Cordyceps confragosa TaxID=2714763 RepID=A0A179IMG8_CORDF|nr:hypothetical protein LLEC1_00200 [Akanthomyces lecanii]